MSEQDNTYQRTEITSDNYQHQIEQLRNSVFRYKSHADFSDDCLDFFLRNSDKDTLEAFKGYLEQKRFEQKNVMDIIRMKIERLNRCPYIDNELF